MITRPLSILDGVGLANTLVCSLQLRLLFGRHTSSMLACAVIYPCHFLWKRSLEVLVTAAKGEPVVPTATCHDVFPRLGYLSAQTLILAPVLMSIFFFVCVSHILNDDAPHKTVTSNAAPWLVMATEIYFPLMSSRPSSLFTAIKKCHLTSKWSWICLISEVLPWSPSFWRFALPDEWRALNHRCVECLQTALKTVM